MEKSHPRKIFPILILFILFITSTTSLVWASSSSQTADEGKTIFEERCAACHTIGGGDLVGPDLQGVTQHRDRQWLINFIDDPAKMIADGDPIATDLLNEYNEVTMPSLGLTSAEIEQVLTYLESQPTTDQPQGEQAQSLPQGDSARGENLFTGQITLQKGGIPCMGCHSVDGVGQYGGGNLGPDLTHVLQRYGQTGLANALGTLPFPTMQGPYANKALTPQEQADLLAFFEQADAQGTENQAATFTPWFWGAGLAGVLVLFSVMAIFWPRQRMSISENLRRQS